MVSLPFTASPRVEDPTTRNSSADPDTIDTMDDPTLASIAAQLDQQQPRHPQPQGQGQAHGQEKGEGQRTDSSASSSYDDDEEEDKAGSEEGKSKGATTTLSAYAQDGKTAQPSSSSQPAIDLPFELTSDETASPASPKELTTVLRKIDWIMMPMMSCVYLLTFLDKTAITYAHLLNFQDDLGFNGYQYSWLTTVFYLGYLFATPIHGFLFQRLPLGRYLAFCILLWATVLGLHGACFTYAAMVVCRLFLGIFEAAITPGFILITGRFYTRKEQITRTSLWFSMNGWAQVVGGLISYGVLRQKPGALAVWREIFIILGCITFTLGLVTLFLFPSSPESFSRLTPREKVIAVERIRKNQTGLHDKRFKWYQVKESLLDPRLYFLFIHIFANDLANGGFTAFNTTIISSFGFNQENTSLLGLAVGFSEVVAVGVVVVLSKITKTRSIPGIITLGVAVAGSAIVVALPASDKSNAPVLMVGVCLLIWFATGTVIIYSTLSSSFSGETKKITMNVFFQIGYSAGNCVGPQLFTSKQAPAYQTGKVVMMVSIVIAWIAFAALFGYHWLENRHREKLFPGITDEDHDAKLDLSDLTDKEKKRTFRYPL